MGAFVGEEACDRGQSLEHHRPRFCSAEHSALDSLSRKHVTSKVRRDDSRSAPRWETGFGGLGEKETGPAIFTEGRGRCEIPVAEHGGLWHNDSCG